MYSPAETAAALAQAWATLPDAPGPWPLYGALAAAATGGATATRLPRRATGALALLTVALLLADATAFTGYLDHTQTAHARLEQAAREHLATGHDLTLTGHVTLSGSGMRLGARDPDGRPRTVLVRFFDADQDQLRAGQHVDDPAHVTVTLTVE